MHISRNYRFLLKLGSGLALLNVVLNAAAAWLVLHTYRVVALWGPTSMAALLFCSGAMTGLILGYMATKATRHALRTCQAQPLHWHLKCQTLIDRMPAGAFHRSFILGLSGTFFAFLTLLLLDMQDWHVLPVRDFMVLFSIQAALSGGGIAVMAFYRALSDEVAPKTKIAA